MGEGGALEEVNDVVAMGVWVWGGEVGDGWLEEGGEMNRGGQGELEGVIEVGAGGGEKGGGCLGEGEGGGEGARMGAKVVTMYECGNEKMEFGGK